MNGRREAAITELETRLDAIRDALTGLVETARNRYHVAATAEPGHSPADGAAPCCYLHGLAQGYRSAAARLSQALDGYDRRADGLVINGQDRVDALLGTCRTGTCHHLDRSGD